MPLPDHLVVYPNHGAGSACGKKMSQETTDTLGNQKKNNYALREDMTREEFIAELLEGLTAPPGYFPKNVVMNIQGYESLDDVMDRAEQPLDADAFELVANESRALILDTRSDADFARGFVPNSVNIGLDGNFAQMVGEMIPDIKQEILLVTDPGDEEESIIRLSRVGYDHVIGYLKGGFETWKKTDKEIDSSERMQAEAFAKAYGKGDYKLFDVRKKSEFDSQHIKGAHNVPLNEINMHLAEFPKDAPFALHCEGGYRSMIATSILKQRGFDNFIDVEGGFEDLKETPIEMTEYVCPSTLL